MSDWYYERDGTPIGPLSSTQLKSLAAAGQIRPANHVRKGSNGKWVSAMKVKGLFESSSAAPPPPQIRSTEENSKPVTDAASDQESVVWSGRPSQITNVGFFILIGLLSAPLWGLISPLFIFIPIALSFWRWLVIKCIDYELTSERLIFSRGVLSRRTDELELYRVKDISFVQPFFLRMFSLANIVIKSSDRSASTTNVEAIPSGDAEQLRETIRQSVERLRAAKGVREIDMR